MASEPSGDQEELDEFVRSTSDAPDSLPNVETESGTAADDLNRRRRKHPWAVLVPLYLIGGFFALRFASAVFSETGRQAAMLDLGIAMFLFMIAFLVNTKNQQEQSEE